jgi:dynein heavy chain
MRDREILGVMKIAESVKAQLDEFRPKVPLLIALRKKGMTNRHWDQVTKAMGFDTPLRPDEGFNFAKALQIGLMDKVDKMVDIGETAGKEYQIEQMLESMITIWDGIKFQVQPYKNTFIIRGYDEIQVVLDEHIVNTQAMVFSPFKKYFEERIFEWDKTLKRISDILEEWAKFQG